MRRRRALVTGIGGDIGQSLIKCLNTSGHPFDLIGCDIDPCPAARILVKSFYQAPKAAETESYLKFIERLIRNEDIRYFFPSTEVEIEFFSKHKNHFDGKDVKFFIDAPDVIETFFDKYKTVIFLKERNFPYPRTYLLEDYNYELPFPVILKQRKGSGGKGMLVINDSDEIDFYRKRMKGAVIQEAIGTDNEEYTAGVFSTGKTIYSITFKRRLGYDNLSKVAELVYDDKLKQLTEAIARAASLEGVLNIQLRKTDSGYIPFEINPRFSSTVYIRHRLGFTDVKWWIDLKEGQRIEYKPRYNKATAVRVLTEVFFDMQKKI